MTQDWALMDTTTAAATVGAYLVGILVLRLFMGFRGKGYNVKSLVLIHNMGMFLLSAYMCVETIRQAWLANYSLFGTPTVHDNGSVLMRLQGMLLTSLQRASGWHGFCTFSSCRRWHVCPLCTLKRP